MRPPSGCSSALVAGTTLALYLAVVRDLPSYTDGFQVPWWALALGFAATEVFVIHAHIRGSAHTLSLSELPLVVGLLLAAPQDLIIAQVVGPIADPPLRPRQRAGQGRVQRRAVRAHRDAVGDRAARARPGAGRDRPRRVDRDLRRRRRRLARRRRARARGHRARRGARCRRAQMLRMFGADLVVSLTNTSIGLAGATLIAQDWTAGWLIVPPAAVLVLAYRAYLSEHTKHQSLEFLYGVARSLSRAPDVETALVDLLERTRESFRVRTAEIILFGAGRRPAAAHVARRSPARRSRCSPSRTSSPTPCAPACPTSTPPSSRAARRPPRWRRTWTSTGIREVAIAPVPGETRLVGVMLLGDRLGATSALPRLRPAPVRDARRPRRHVARVRPPRAGDPAHARAAGRARAPGLPRPAHRPRQPRAVHAPRARVARPPRRHQHRAVPRPRRLQADQRPRRPRRRRRRADGRRRADPPLRAPQRPRGPARRRRVRRAARGRRRAPRRGGRAPDRRAALARP